MKENCPDRRSEKHAFKQGITGCYWCGEPESAHQALSGGERILKDSGGKPREQSSPPTQLREIAEKCVAQINCPFEDNPKVLEAVIRAMQEAWELGYRFACDANNMQFKYGYKKGLEDGDDSHALQ